MKILSVLHVPFLLVLTSLLQLLYIASFAVSPMQIIRPLGVLWGVLALLSLLLYRLTDNADSTALLLSAFALCLFFSPGFFWTVLLFTAIAVAAGLVFTRLHGRPFTLRQLLTVLTGSVYILLSVSLFLLAAMLLRIPWPGYLRSLEAAGQVPPESLVPPAEKPDIYYLILDDYGRADVLQELYGFDNSSFLESLTGMGFIIPEASRTNYPVTPLSVASTLNMEYIQTLAPDLDRQANRWLMEPFIDHSRVRALLESQGYRSVSIGSSWSITDNPTTGLYLHPFPVMLSDFEGFVLDSTPLYYARPVLGRFASLPSTGSHREVIRFHFESLASLAAEPGPKFVFAHILSPHPPFVFDRYGNPVQPEIPFTFQDGNELDLSRQDYSRQYIEQLLFVNDRLLSMIHQILAGSSTPPIILIQADHGPGLLTDLGSAENTCIRERFSPFAAYYLPGVDGAAISADISAVNLFRIVFNEYFDAGLPLLENRQYFYQDTETYYVFEDVTGRYGDRCTLPGK